MYIVRLLDKALITLACCSLFFMMSMTFLDVVMRSIFNAPIQPATELTRIAMAVIIFSVLPKISFTGEHIVVDLTDGIYDRFRIAHIRDALIQIFCGAVLAWPTMKVWKLALRAKEYGDVTEYLSIPQFWIGSFIGMSVALTSLLLLACGMVNLFQIAKGRANV